MTSYLSREIQNKVTGHLICFTGIDHSKQDEIMQRTLGYLGKRSIPFQTFQRTNFGDKYYNNIQADSVLHIALYHEKISEELRFFAGIQTSLKRGKSVILPFLPFEEVAPLAPHSRTHETIESDVYRHRDHLRPKIFVLLPPTAEHLNGQTPKYTRYERFLMMNPEAHRIMDNGRTIDDLFREDVQEKIDSLFRFEQKRASA